MSRDLVLAQESTGDLYYFDACVKNRIKFYVLVYSQNDTKRFKFCWFYTDEKMLNLCVNMLDLNTVDIK